MIEGLKPLYNSILRPIAMILAKIGVHPNHLTLCGVLLFGTCGFYTAFGRWKFAIIFMVLGACMDGLDGVLAREANKKSVFGAIFDSVCDRITEILWLGGILWYYLYSQDTNFLGAILVFTTITGSILISYVKARAEGAGVDCSRGLMQRPERLIIVAAFQMLGPARMIWGLGALSVLCYVTVIQRIVIVWQNAKKVSR